MHSRLAAQPSGHHCHTSGAVGFQHPAHLTVFSISLTLYHVRHCTVEQPVRLSLSPSDVHSFCALDATFGSSGSRRSVLSFWLVTMKPVFSSLAGFAATLSLLTATQAASNSTDAPSCGAIKADDSYFSIVGVQGTGVHPRQELRELEKDTETWNIFLQAFARFQAMDESEKVSYYQVAGMLTIWEPRLAADRFL